MPPHPKMETMSNLSCGSKTGRTNLFIRKSLLFYDINDNVYSRKYAFYFIIRPHGGLLCTRLYHFIRNSSWIMSYFFKLYTYSGSHPVWPRDSFGPTLTSARKYFGPEYFGPEILWPETTSARRILRPAYILRPGNNFGPENSSARLYTSAWKYFGPIDFGPLHFGPGTKLSKVSFFTIFDLP